MKKLTSSAELMAFALAQVAELTGMEAIISESGRAEVERMVREAKTEISTGHDETA